MVVCWSIEYTYKEETRGQGPAKEDLSQEDKSKQKCRNRERSSDEMDIRERGKRR